MSIFVSTISLFSLSLSIASICYSILALFNLFRTKRSFKTEKFVFYIVLSISSVIFNYRLQTLFIAKQLYTLRTFNLNTPVISTTVCKIMSFASNIVPLSLTSLLCLLEMNAIEWISYQSFTKRDIKEKVLNKIRFALIALFLVIFVFNNIFQFCDILFSKIDPFYPKNEFCSTSFPNFVVLQIANGAFLAEFG
ncbi:hypothetical protein MHBO_002408 [Bonamia ostreae]|uniref:Serpentine receptor class gamma n=1 Tax=Bonamia ostreae TaxID=126728 RepID=A0ABV2AM83_9EUKA